MGEKKSDNLEVLRGFAALIVVFHHVIVHHRYFNKDYFPARLGFMNPPGHVSVLIFFVLSGYVIGLTNKKRLSGVASLQYLKKRFVRIYPIYFLALVFSLLIVSFHYSLRDTIANFTLTQNIFALPVWEDNPIWSLNYEALYYLLFIPFSFLNIRPQYIVMGSLALGILWQFTHFNSLVAGYSFGLCFWATGLYMARDLRPAPASLRILPLLLLILCVPQLLLLATTIVNSALEILHIPNRSIGSWNQTTINLQDLKYFPFAFLMVLLFSGREIYGKKYFAAGLYAFVLSLVVINYKKHSFEFNLFGYNTLLFCLAFIVYLFRFSEVSLRKAGTWLGSISYGVYIIHFPILFLMGRRFFEAPNGFAYAFKVLVLLGLTLAAAYLLEKTFQSFIKRKLFGGLAKQHMPLQAATLPELIPRTE